MTNLNDLKISIAGKCSHCGHALHETFVAQGKHQNIEQRIVPATPDSVLHAVCEATGIAPGDLASKSGQRKDFALARQMYVWLLRRHLSLPWRIVGESVHYVDHTSAIAAYDLFQQKWDYYLHEVLIVPTPENSMKEWFSDKGDGVLWLHVDNLVNDLKVAYGAILRSKIKVKK